MATSGDERRRGDRVAAAVVYGVWVVTSAGALGLVARYGTRVMPQADELAALDGAGRETLVNWLWKPWAEHRIPLAKLVWVGGLRVTGYDFRVGNFLSVLVLSAVAFGMIRTARAVRGRTAATDALFPLAILSLGQAQVILWWWQVNHVLAPVVASVLLMVVVRWGNRLGARWAAAMGAGLVVLALCGPGGLPHVLAFTVWLGAWAKTNWRTLDGGGRRWGGVGLALAGAAVALVAMYFVDYTPHFPGRENPEVSPWPDPAGVKEAATAGTQLLALGLGTATKRYALYCGLGVLAAGLCAVGLLVRAWLRERAERLRALGMLLYLGAATIVVFAVARSRAGLGLDYLFLGHYLMLVAPALCCVYLVWELYGGSFGRRWVRCVMLAALIVPLPMNVQNGLAMGRGLRRTSMEFEADVRRGVPAGVIAEWYYGGDVMPDVETAAAYLRGCKERGVGFMREIGDDPAWKVEGFAVESVGAARADWRDGVASGSGEMVIALGRVRRVYAVRLRYEYVKTAGDWATMRVSWGLGGQRGEFVRQFPNPERATWAMVDGKIRTGVVVHRERVVTVWMDALVDEIRVEPDSRPYVFRLGKVEVLTGGLD